MKVALITLVILIVLIVLTVAEGRANRILLMCNEEYNDKLTGRFSILVIAAVLDVIIIIILV